MKTLSSILILSFVALYFFAYFLKYEINNEVMSQELTPFLMFIFINFIILFSPTLGKIQKTEQNHNVKLNSQIHTFISLIILNLFVYNIFFLQYPLFQISPSIFYFLFYINLAYTAIKGIKTRDKVNESAQVR